MIGAKLAKRKGWYKTANLLHLYSIWDLGLNGIKLFIFYNL